MPRLSDPTVAAKEDASAVAYYASLAQQTKAPTRVAQYDAKGKLIGYLVTTYNQDGTVASVKFEAATDTTPTADAGDAALNNILTSYGLEGMAATLGKIRADYPEATSDQVLALLKTDPRYNAAYLTRFAGNEALMKKGLPTLDDATYLKTEKEYEKILKAYDLTSLATRAQYAELIGNSMDAVDVTNRVQLGYNRLKNDAATLAKFREYYPGLSDGDIVAAMLKPDVMLPVLERKVTVAEISGAAALQGLESSQIRSEELMGLGVNEAVATAGFQQVAKKTPRGKFLSEISPETGVKYTQTTAEDIAFKKSVEAQRQEDVLVGKEIGRFGGSAGRLASKQRTSGLI